ncbi:MAG: GPR endopeptidase [Clostridia bacterium]|nr:GPR endopeptidase [Clostridia bacterium]
MKNIDLALESRELHRDVEGVDVRTEQRGGHAVTVISVNTPQAAKTLGKPVGTYTTVELQTAPGDDESLIAAAELIADALRTALPTEGCVLFCGLGNLHVTPDSLGPLTANKVIATRHLTETEPDLAHLRPVSAIFPGVLAQTGMESAEILVGLVRQIRPAAVVTVDALAAQKLSRLGRAVQICNTGIAPGSGVGNHRRAINAETLGCSVISVGIPLVVDGATLCCDLLGADGSQRADIEQKAAQREPLIVTHTDIDKTVETLSVLLALAFNMAVQPSFSPQELLAIMG